MRIPRMAVRCQQTCLASRPACSPRQLPAQMRSVQRAAGKARQGIATVPAPDSYPHVTCGGRSRPSARGHRRSQRHRTESAAGLTRTRPLMLDDMMLRLKRQPGRPTAAGAATLADLAGPGLPKLTRWPPAKNGLRGGLPSPALPGSGPWGSPSSLSAIRPLSLPVATPVTRRLVRSSSLDHLADDVYAAFAHDGHVRPKVPAWTGPTSGSGASSRTGALDGVPGCQPQTRPRLRTVRSAAAASGIHASRVPPARSSTAGRCIRASRESNGRRHDQSCIAAAGDSGGLCWLAAPTGSGKTLAAAAVALRHAATHGKARVIVAVPFITITEQNAGVYRQLWPSSSSSSRVT